MSLYVGVNGTQKKVSSLYVGVNGVPKEVNELYMWEQNNRKLVYTKGFNIDEELDVVNPIAAIESGKITKRHIGKKIILSNSIFTCQEWIIIGVNSGGDMGTVDLISKTTLWNSCADGGQPNYNTYVGYNNPDSTAQDGITDLSDGTSANTVTGRMVNGINGFTKDIQGALQPMTVEYLNKWYSGTYGGTWASYETTQKICLPGDGDIGLYLENGTVIKENQSGMSSVYRTDRYCGIYHPYFNHNIKWSKSTYSDMEYDSSVYSYDTAQLLELAKAPNGKQVKYPLRSCKYNTSYSRYYIDTNGRRQNANSYYFNSTYTAGAIIRLGNPAFAKLKDNNPISFLQTSIDESFLGRSVNLYKSDATLIKWFIVNVDKTGVTLMGSLESDAFPSYYFNRVISKGNVYETSELRTYINNAILGLLPEATKNALKDQTYVSNGKKLTDKVVVPSATELGLYGSNEKITFAQEGTRFQLFGIEDINCKSFISDMAWTRTALKGNSTNAIQAYGNGKAYSYSVNNNDKILVCIKL